MKTEYEVFVSELMRVLRAMAGFTEKQVRFAQKGTRLARTGDRILIEASVHENGAEMCGVYVEEMYERYRDGEDICRIGGEILAELRRVQNSRLFLETKKIARYETAKSSLFIRLLNRKDHEKELESAVYRTFGEIALVLYMKVTEEDGCLTSMKIRREYLESWGEEENEVFEGAVKNTFRMAPPRIYFWYKLLDDDTYDGEDIMAEGRRVSLRTDLIGNCLSTTQRTNGAVAIFLPGVAARLASLLHGDLYLVFTSVHEVMVHKADSVDIEDLKEVLGRTVRETTPKEDFLSVQIYCYSQENREFSCVTKLGVPTYPDIE